MRLPNFLIIGAGRSGTSSLVRYLIQHPSIYMITIEPSFFALEGEKLNFRSSNGRDSHTNRASVTDLASYSALFEGVKDEKAVGEKSPLYLYHPEAPARIKKYIPEVKLIAILRNPVERAFSNYLHIKNEGREPLSFEQAIVQEPERIKNRWGYEYYYLEQGFYYRHLKRYFDIFERRQLKVLLYDDLKINPLLVVKEVFQFLEVDDLFNPSISLKHNISGIPRSRLIDNFIRSKSHPLKSLIKRSLPNARLREHLRHWLRDMNLYKPELSNQTRKKLREIYQEDILKLQSLIARDLSSWLK